MIAAEPKTADGWLEVAFRLGASDVHFNPGNPPRFRIGGDLKECTSRAMTPDETFGMARELLGPDQWAELERTGEVDFAHELPGLVRCRVNVYRQRQLVNLAFRLLNPDIPSLHELGLPPLVEELAVKRQGLVLVTGPTGSGKSTTLAAIIDYINRTQSRHIITLEDPIEYVHTSRKSLITQREVGRDTATFHSGLRAALRQDPDVILVGEMRDLETISTAISAAETGHLVLATLHTPDAPQTVDRIIDVFPTQQQRQIRIQLASVLVAVLSQRLIPKLDGEGRALAMEVLVNTPAVANLIRQEKIFQLQSLMQTSRHLGMQTMASSIRRLVAEGIVHKDALHQYEHGLKEGDAE
jgi:twitching motility protein PilT